MPLLALAVLATLLGSVAFTAAAYAGAARHRRRHAPECGVDDREDAPWPARMLGWLWMFLRECAVTALAVSSAPLRPRRRRSAPPERPDRHRPVILLVARGQLAVAALWLSRRLRRGGWLRVHGLGCGRLARRLERDAERLATVVDRVRRMDPASLVDVVAHGTGGLVARAYLRERGRSSGIGRLITLGTPHQGTLAFRRHRLDPASRLRPGSPLLRWLAEDDPVPALVDCISIFSSDDALTVPSGGAYWPGAVNIELRHVGHGSLLVSSRVYQLVCENLAESAEPEQRVVTSS